MIPELEKTLFFQALASHVGQEPSLLFESLWDAPKALIALFIKKYTGKNVLIITGGERENLLCDDLSYFSKELILSFPSSEILPGEDIPPSPDIVGKRLEILHHLLKKKGPHIILTPIQGILQKVTPPSVIRKKFLTWKKGDEISFDRLPEILMELGYHRQPIAADKGEFAVRGGILDIFPISAFDPYRIDFFGDEIDDIRTFDPISQKSIEKKDRIFIAPAEEHRDQNELGSFLEYLGDHTVILFDDLLAIEDRYIALKNLSGMHSRFFLSFDDFMKSIANFQKVFFTKEPLEKLSVVTLEKKIGRSYYAGGGIASHLTFEIFDETFETKRINHPFIPIDSAFPIDETDLVASILKNGGEMKLLFLSSSEAEERVFKERMHANEHPHWRFERGYLSSGFALEGDPFAIIPYTEFTKRHKIQRQKWRNTYHTPASEFHQLEKGDLVVHFHNGIGKFLGIEVQKNHLGNPEEFLIIEYANSSKLFVPLSQSHLTSRYIGTKEDMPTLSTLGTKKWHNTKVHTEQAIIGYAQELINLQANREAKGGFIFPEDSEMMKMFEEEFPFVETDDQILAIKDFKADMCSSKAMDRLICGDVGYGKTEVAMRAAFKAVADGKMQVAVLVPTTVLAMQHYQTFCERMENFPINIGVASRFVSQKKVKETLHGISTGAVDILIGTHRIISKDVQFKNLGLIIIDEEQRFGVRVKEHLKKAKIGVDCLTLSATPIPRTLYFSLLGARDMSIINTPPHDRLPIKTILAEKDPELVKNALMRELTRDGQAYIIHNRVESIYSIAKEIEELIPEAKIGVVHGQMATDEIDSVFHLFKTGETDILIATTIVENGVDIPNANTILIDRADAYGMADLYQLRGRVGRWNRPAFAYFLVPKNRALPEISRKRLQALIETSGFGGGLKLAMRDLEIRGAGDLLGVQQSGNVAAIGFHFYCKLLKRAIDTLKKHVSPTFFDTRMEFKFDALLPSTYIYETNLRIEIYHRLGEMTTNEEVDDLFKELQDRFGPLPIQAKWLYHLNRLRIFASNYQFTLLKLEKIGLTAIRQLAKTTVEKKAFLPSSATPEELEMSVIKILKREFQLS